MPSVPRVRVPSNAAPSRKSRRAMAFDGPGTRWVSTRCGTPASVATATASPTLVWYVMMSSAMSASRSRPSRRATALAR
jgi:hypothetical protein